MSVHLAALIRILRTCSFAVEAAEALTGALAAPSLWGERPVASWIQLEGRVLYGAPRGESMVGFIARWVGERGGPAVMSRGPAVPTGATTPVPVAWTAVSAPWSETGSTLVWPIEGLGGTPVGAFCLHFPGVRTIGAWGSPEHGGLLVSAASPYLLGLPCQPKETVHDRGPLLPVVGAAMAPLVDTLEAYARSEEVLLLRGPTGTGKSRLASWCWSRSTRASRRLVVANLLGVPETGQDSELFGVRRGTFTGVGERLGQLQSAHHGTLFIDEVDKLALTTQSRLLRVLDERRYYVLGDAAEKAADVRFIVASNADLEAAVAERRLLEDLYYRINVMPVSLPPLRDRIDEIGPWARHMANELHSGRGGKRVSLTSEAEVLLLEQPWPGNLRQLNNVVRRAYAFAALEVTPSEGPLPEELELVGAHVRRALGSGAVMDRGEPAALEALRRAAAGLVGAALRRRSAGQPPLEGRDGDLELADAFRGLVLQIAADRLGDPRKAFELFGIEGRLKGGNHLRTWRLAHRQVEALRAALEADEP